MKIIHFLLLPLAFLYGFFIRIWLFLYQKGVWGKVNFAVPIISVGNIQAGGTGKTPMVDYLCGILSSQLSIGVLSRGYKRLSYGFRIVHESDKYQDSGDEPLWLKRRHPNILVGVAENRVEGIPYLLSHGLYTNAVVLDDGYQQLGINLDVNILLTPYHRPFTRDFFLPSGRLREPRSSSERADIIVITKCPESLLSEKEKVIRGIGLKYHGQQQIFLSSIYYSSPHLIFYEGMIKTIRKDEQILLVTGIADSVPLKEYLETKAGKVMHLSYRDHYRYDLQDFEYICKKFEELDDRYPVRILTTEKDAVRLYPFKERIVELNLPLYVLPISVRLDDEQGFIQAVYDKLPERYDKRNLDNP